jgi:hypothetical protein
MVRVLTRSAESETEIPGQAAGTRGGGGGERARVRTWVGYSRSAAAFDGQFRCSAARSVVSTSANRISRMSPSGIDFSDAVTASGPSLRICSRSWPKRASDSCMAVAILFRSAATSAPNAPPLEAEGEARLTMLGVRAGRRGNRSARIGRSRRSQSCRRTNRGQSHAVRRWSYLVATRCSGSSTWRISWAVPELGRIRGAGQLELATTRTDIPLDSYVLHEFGVASPADPTDGLAVGPPFSGARPGAILLPRANVAGLNIWGDDLHPWRCPSSLVAYPNRSVLNDRLVGRLPDLPITTTP